MSPNATCDQVLSGSRRTTSRSAAGSFAVIVAEPQDVGLFPERRGTPAERRLERVLRP